MRKKPQRKESFKCIVNSELLGPYQRLIRDCNFKINTKSLQNTESGLNISEYETIYDIVKYLKR